MVGVVAKENGSYTNENSLPVSSLLALACAGFITILTETLPAGLLSKISLDLGVSDALSGQLVSIYALGSLVAAIPLTVASQGLRRRLLLLIVLGGFVIANTITTFSHHYVLTMIARFFAGVAAGLLWALLAGYAVRMVAEHQKGKAMAIAMVGTPLALSLGVPAGAFLGDVIGWRACFGIMSLLALFLMLWVRCKVPDFAGQKAEKRVPLMQVFMLNGVRSVLCAVLGFVLAHNVLYTYITPLMGSLGLEGDVGLALLIFGISALCGIWVIGVLIDRYLRLLTLSSTVLFGLAVLLLGCAGENSVLVYIAIATWGIAFGGAATLFQTAMAQAAGSAADVAQSMLVTIWNIAIAGGGVLGGMLLTSFGVNAFSPVLIVLLLSAFAVVWLSKKTGFPASEKH